MPSLTDHQSSTMTKLLLIGDSGSGKTSSLVSLVEAGYRIRVLDMDNGLSSLVQQIKKRCPERLGQVDFVTLRDPIKATASGPLIQARVFVKALGLMEKWEDGSNPKDWGKDAIFVLDSLTLFSDAAFNWAKSMNPNSKDPRQWYGQAQSVIEDVIAYLTSVEFNTNLIIISHISWVERPDGTMKGYASSVGKALGPTIPVYFDNVALMQTVGNGAAAKRTLQTMPTSMIDLKNPTPFKLAAQLPIDTGLADFFTAVRS